MPETQIERRLARLEAQNRRLRAGLTAVMLVAAAAVSMGASNDRVADLIQARRIEIVDGGGRALVRLGEDGGQGFAAMLDALGNYKVQLSALMQGGTLVLKTTTERPTTVDLSLLVVNEVAMVGSRCGPFERALDALRGGAVPVERLIAARYPLAEGEAAFARAQAGGVLKVLLRIG